MNSFRISVFFLINMLLLVMNVNCVNQNDSQCVEVKDREKRGLLFPINSATGILVAIAVPLVIPHRNVFVSYNFEANYNMPTTATDVTQGPLKRLDLVDTAEGRKQSSKAEILANNSNCTTANGSRSVGKIMPKLITRKKTYGILINKLNSEGLNGKKCLLRGICESADIPLHVHNGVLGSILHIILTPSASKNESIPAEFYTAESLGKKGNCDKYRKSCEKNVLDILSQVIYA